MNKLIPFFVVLTACGKANSSALPVVAPSTSALEQPVNLHSPQAPQRDQGSPSAAQQGLAVANEIRRQNGLPEMTADPILSAVAQSFAEDMLRRHFFDHNSPEGETPFQRMDKAGLRYNAAAENIAMGVNDAHQAFDMWLGSPGHRRNLLNKVYGRHGIGFAGGYWVHDFAN